MRRFSHVLVYIYIIISKDGFTGFSTIFLPRYHEFQEVLFMLTEAQAKLLSKKIIHSDGSPVKEKINIISGIYAAPFAVAFWTSTSQDSCVSNNMLTMLKSFCEAGRYSDAVSLLSLIYGIIGHKVPDEIIAISADPATLLCFLREFILDLDELFTEMAAETTIT